MFKMAIRRLRLINRTTNNKFDPFEIIEKLKRESQNIDGHEKIPPTELLR